MREVAKRVFAGEYRESDLMVKDGEDEFSPSYVITPTGERCNRLFIVGVLTEVQDIGESSELYRARISDPTGTFLAYAGNFQPEANRFLSEIEPPSFVALSGKANIYEPDENTAIASIRPEIIKLSNETERDRWIVRTAQLTLERLSDIDKDVRDHYDTDRKKYQDMVKKALEVVIEEVENDVTESNKRLNIEEGYVSDSPSNDVGEEDPDEVKDDRKDIGPKDIVNDEDKEPKENTEDSDEDNKEDKDESKEVEEWDFSNI